MTFTFAKIGDGCNEDDALCVNPLIMPVAHLPSPIGVDAGRKKSYGVVGEFVKDDEEDDDSPGVIGSDSWPRKCED